MNGTFSALMKAGRQSEITYEIGVRKPIPPYQSIYETQGRKSEFELNKMISDLIRKSDRIDDKRMQQIPLYNLDIVSDNIYRGAMQPADKLKLGWTKDFEHTFIKRLNIIKEIIRF